ncbi:energy-coupling factor ABC transporter ATP-binding protein [Roseofilum casamattae]|uniref:ABC transporter ATP-binding protein n=1 Tax=Roseofilum casamattae BLCC-M143 TaxID=3022442 RepID=A0ABT7BTP4_9CYAN|nr:ABC transporter ATP-binding protein [Roseofilum casamattae]MDJ1181673.1 ABC transporter ATP-binding protein [Roseofilum casamattae BLCC-M143]
MAVPLLELNQISYCYPGQTMPTFDRFSLKLERDRKIVLLGRNGSGKSTLLLLMTGLYQINQGQIFWQGQPLDYRANQLRQWRENIGLAFQNPEHQLVAGTVADDISYGLCNLELPEAEILRRIDEAIANFQLQEIAHTPLHHLSLGQKRRVALAGVMAIQPQLLLLDEPTAYLDPQQMQTLLQELGKIEERGTTIAIATHNLNFAYQWADWFIIIDRGNLILEGDATTVFSQQSRLEEMGLGLPSIWELWHSLPRDIRPPNTPVPRTIRDWKTRFNSQS